MFKKLKKKAQAKAKAQLAEAAVTGAPVTDEFIMPENHSFGLYQAIYRCIDCKQELNERQRKMSSGVCPHCQLDSRHSFCATEEGTYIPIMKHFMGFLTRRVGYLKRWGQQSNTVWLHK